MVLDVEPGRSSPCNISTDHHNQCAHTQSLAYRTLSVYYHIENARAEEDTLTIPDVSIIESSAELLYGLVHQRFILTKAGLQAMVRCSSSPSLPFI